MRRHAHRVVRLLALAPALVLVAAACSRDILDVDIDLAPHAFQADFGPSSGTIPTVTCDATTANACTAGQVVDAADVQVAAAATPVDVAVAIGCDPATSRCFAQATARLTYELAVLQDDGFVTKLERDSLSFVRLLDLGYTMPTNTLTFDVPHIDVYVGPEGTRTETDPGVVLVDSIPRIGAGVTFTDERHLTVDDGSPARALIESSIQAEVPFVFVLVATPRLEAGAPVPGGAFEIDAFPKVRVGLPR